MKNTSLVNQRVRTTPLLEFHRTSQEKGLKTASPTPNAGIFYIDNPHTASKQQVEFVTASNLNQEIPCNTNGKN